MNDLISKSSNSVYFSIIMVTYNHEKYIEKAITSVMGQIFSNWELIIVDDGSIDSTRDIVNSFADPRIRLLSQKNTGINNLSKSYNKALLYCMGEYVCILEGDDYWLNDKLSVQKIKINKDVDVAWSNSHYVDANNKIIGTSKVKISKNDGYLINLINDGLLYGNLITPSPTVIFRRVSLQMFGGFADFYGVKVVDYSTVMVMLINGCKYQFIDSVLGCYRRHLQQATQNLSTDIYREHNIILHNIMIDARDSKFKIKTKEYLNAIAWNNILELFSTGARYSILQYSPYLLSFNFKHSIKFLVIILLLPFKRSVVNRLREFFRGFL